MKTKIIFILVSIVIFFSSCNTKFLSIEKRKYMKGYHIDLSVNNNKSSANVGKSKHSSTNYNIQETSSKSEIMVAEPEIESNISFESPIEKKNEKPHYSSLMSSCITDPDKPEKQIGLSTASYFQATKGKTRKTDSFILIFFALLILFVSLAIWQAIILLGVRNGLISLLVLWILSTIIYHGIFEWNTINLPLTFSALLLLGFTSTIGFSLINLSGSIGFGLVIFLILQIIIVSLLDSMTSY